VQTADGHAGQEHGEPRGDGVEAEQREVEPGARRGEAERVRQRDRERRDHREQDGHRPEPSRAPVQDEGRRHEQQPVERQDDADAGVQELDGEADDEDQQTASHERHLQAGVPGSCATLADEADGDAGQHREQQRGASVDDAVPGGRVGPGDVVVGVAQVGADHPEHGQPTGDVDADDAGWSAEPAQPLDGSDTSARRGALLDDGHRHLAASSPTCRAEHALPG
jgi:hypothetical protein